MSNFTSNSNGNNNFNFFFYCKLLISVYFTFNKFMDSNNTSPYSIEFSLKTYPITFLNRTDLEKGDKILLPSNILRKLSEYEIKGPIIFEISNINTKRKSHCGVMDFTADQGCAYLPRWMMENLALKEGEKIQFSYCTLEKGNYVKLQPQTDDFLEISNPKAILEAKLRYFTCLTKLDMIAIEYNNKIYWINVVEVKPGRAISIIDTDIDVDFAPPIIRKNLNFEKSHEEKLELPGTKASERSLIDSSETSSEEENCGTSFKGEGHVMK